MDPFAALEILDPVAEANRKRLRICSFFIIACGILGLIGSFAVYYYGFILAIGYLVAAGITLAHTSSPKDVYQNTCCVSNTGAFGSLRTFFMFNAIGSGIGIAFCIWGIAEHATESEDQFSLYLSLGALLGCVVGLPCSSLAAQTCGELRESINQEVLKLQQVASVGIVPGMVSTTSYPGQPMQEMQVYPQAVPVQSYPAAQPVHNDGYYNNVQQQPVQHNPNQQ